MPYIGNITQDFNVNNAMLDTDSVTSIKIVDGAIVNADINASAAITGTKISPNFGSQNITTTGDLEISSANPKIYLTDTDNNSDYIVQNNNGAFRVYDNTNSSQRFIIGADGQAYFTQELNAQGGLDVTGAITSTSDLTIADKIIHSGDTDTAIRFPAANQISFETGGSEALRVDSSQRLLIGTSSSRSVAAGQALLQIENTTTELLSILNTANDNAGSVLAVGKTRNGAIVQDDDNLGRLAFYGDDGNDVDRAAADIMAAVDGTPGANDMPGRLIFRTTADGGSNPTERMRIDSSGNVGIGTTSPQSILSLKVSASRQLDVIKDSGDDHLVLKSTAPDASYNMRSIELAGSDVSFSTGASSGTSYTESMRIDGNGNVGIGTTSPTGFIHIEGSSNGTETYGRFSTGSANGDQNLYIQSGSSRDHMALQVKTGAGANDDLSLNPSGGNVGIGCTPSNGFLEVKNTSYNGGSTGLLTLEGGSESGVMFKTSSYGNDQHKIATNNNGHMFFRVAAGVRASLTSNGLCFNSDTAAANALDDYEEGTFTFSLGHSLTPTETDGTYTKIGNFCIAAGSITFPSTADGNHAILGGLPFTAANGRPGAAIVRYSNDNEAYKISWHVNAAAASASPYYSDGGGTTANVYFSTKRLDLVFCYRTA